MSGRILVTGGTGFIGTYTVAELKARGYEPVIGDRVGRPSWATLDSALCDVRDREGVGSLVYGCDGVIHLAGELGTQETVPQPHGPAQTNILGTLNVLEAAHKHNVPMVFISVGNYWMDNPYSISKHTAERFCLMFRKELGAKVSVVRALNAYGPGQKAKPVRKIIPTFVKACLRNEPIEVYGSGGQRMDMVYVPDVARVLVEALERQPDIVVEAGTGRDTTVNEIAQAVIDEVGQGSIRHAPMRPGETPESKVVADVSTLAAAGIDPSELTTLEDGLAETVAWYRDPSAVPAALAAA